MSTLSVSVFAAESVQANQQAEIPDGFFYSTVKLPLLIMEPELLLRYTADEYRRPANSNIVPLAEVGEERIYTFDISNTALGFSSLVAGPSLSSAMKSKIAFVVAQKLGEKLAGAFIPGITIASWGLAVIAARNAVSGNESFKITVTITLTVVYAEYFEHKKGIYAHGWDINDCDFDAY